MRGQSDSIDAVPIESILALYICCDNGDHGDVVDTVAIDQGDSKCCNIRDHSGVINAVLQEIVET